MGKRDFKEQAKNGVLVVDDSALMRRMISRILEEAGLEVVGTASNGEEGLKKALELMPAVITLDVEMPVMNGLQLLAELMQKQPTPVVMVSALTERQAPEAVKALSLGAVDVLAKPGGSISLNLEDVGQELVRKVRAAAGARVRQPAASGRKNTAVVDWGSNRPRKQGIVVTGSSTGGPGALTELLEQLPAAFPLPVVSVQHMPEGFTASLARRLDKRCALTVKEAEVGKRPRAGEVWIARGGQHLVFEPGGKLAFNDGPPVHFVKPAVDVTWEAAANKWKDKVIGVILTGMGMDGSKGARAIRRAGGQVIAQDEQSCVVYGMPRAVIEMGQADHTASLEKIPSLLQQCIARL